MGLDLRGDKGLVGLPLEPIPRVGLDLPKHPSGAMDIGDTSLLGGIGSNKNEA
jgi:hypothetical protein